MKTDIATIIKDHLDKITVTPHQQKVLDHIIGCRTEKMGEHIMKCDNEKCNHEEHVFNSCQDRNCPKCQGDKQLKWKLKRLEELLPIEYSHIIFSIPGFLHKLFLYNNKACYNILFQAVNKVLKEYSELIGFYNIIHTWTQHELFHPHIHCVLPEIKIINRKKTKRFTLKKGNLNINFKKALLKLLLKEIDKGNINTLGLSNDEIRNSLLNGNNNIYLKQGIKDSAFLVNYLGNNVNRIGLSDNRIVNYDGEIVEHKYIDRKDGNKVKTEEVKAVDFIKRYIIHILPARLTKIRYYGFLANNNKELLKSIKSYIEANNDLLISKSKKVIIDKISRILNYLKKGTICNKCQIGILTFYAYIKPKNGY